MSRKVPITTIVDVPMRTCRHDCQTLGTESDSPTLSKSAAVSMLGRRALAFVTYERSRARDPKNRLIDTGSAPSHICVPLASRRRTHCHHFGTCASVRPYAPWVPPLTPPTQPLVHNEQPTFTGLFITTSMSVMCIGKPWTHNTLQPMLRHDTTLDNISCQTFKEHTHMGWRFFSWWVCQRVRRMTANTYEGTSVGSSGPPNGRERSSSTRLGLWSRYSEAPFSRDP
ncbi:hypothetical protein F4780DRAFT_658728 [Xylariomycetidae sp. FL0641]|nr:hypothetical protein F4780DRAFT_658728 [Xylariomycetidae sp. FL0641]